MKAKYRMSQRSDYLCVRTIREDSSQLFPVLPWCTLGTPGMFVPQVASELPFSRTLIAPWHSVMEVKWLLFLEQ